MVTKRCSYCDELVKRNGVYAAQWKKAFCSRAHQRLYTLRDSAERRAKLLVVGEKCCGKCKTIKKLSDFFTEQRRPDGFSSWCKACCAESARGVRERRLIARPGHDRTVNLRGLLRRRYGIDLLDFQLLADMQRQKCAICGGVGSKHPNKQRLHVDHCHVTKKIRGLLCHSCNVALGLFKDDAVVLRKAAAYLERQDKNVSVEDVDD